jgi:hypothetical protein
VAAMTTDQPLSTNAMFIELIKQGERHSTLIESLVDETRSLNGKYGALLERTAKTEALNGVQDEKIESNTRRADAARDEREELKKFMYKALGAGGFFVLVLEAIQMLNQFGIF